MSVLLWPVKATWHLTAAVLEVLGRMLSLVVGFLLVIIGIVVSLTVIGAVIGIPLMLLGFVLILRGLF
ncbi:MAG: hypothetical protein L0154_01935 [Chloroflexi bacterium]|nr:hypothetical protein [Chloroflexota bacterium]